MRARVQKWGNSLAVRIPKAFAKQAALAQDSDVDLALENGRLIITPVPERRYVLEEMLDRITPDSIHEEVDFGPPVGKEEW
jgi:antitoxin MazE